MQPLWSLYYLRKDRPLLHKYVAIELQRNWLQCIISQMQTLLAVGDRLPEQRDEFRLQKKFRIQRNLEKFILQQLDHISSSVERQAS